MTQTDYDRYIDDTLTRAILDASEALDPQHQGEAWPDPIAWDGRPLQDQARDLLPLLEEDRYRGERDQLRRAMVHPTGCRCDNCEADRGDYEYHRDRDERLLSEGWPS